MSKKNPKAEVEVIYEKGHAPEPDLLSALEACQTTPESTYAGYPVRRTAGDVGEVATLHLGGSSDVVLFARPRAVNSLDPRRMQSWRPIARFVEEQMGSHKFLIGRKYSNLEPSSSQFAALEHAFGRAKGTSLADVLRPDREHAEPATIEAEALVTLRSGSRVLWLRWNGLWLSVATFSRYAARRAEDVEREARSAAAAAENRNYPHIAVI